jgi:GTP cyclohydrolase I
VELTWDDVQGRASVVAQQIVNRVGKGFVIRVHPIPRGGIHAAQAVVAAAADLKRTFRLVSRFEECHVMVDDIIDSGATRKKYDGNLNTFFALVDKQEEGITDWVKFPWEVAANEQGPEENIRRILEYIGEDPDREGLLETPHRVVKSYAELFSGYKYKTDEDISAFLKVFKDGACEEMVLVKDISFTSFCEHHMLPFEGVAHVAYLPQGRIIGLSKIPRLVEVYSRRLQVQERLTQQITGMMDKLLKPKGSACVIEASHSCMSCRGVRQSGAKMLTSSLTGEFLDSAVRQEFFSHVNR